MKYYIGADLGTSSCKLLLTDGEGNILRSVTEAYDVSYPHPGWSEQDPRDWWTAFCNGVKKLTEDVDASLVRGLSVAGQMHGLVVLDGEDEVIRPVILWNDGRTFRENEYLNGVIGKETLASLTANISFAGFTAPKLLWMKEHEPENFAKIKKIMLPKDYINYRLTGVHACDYSDASGLLLLDVKHRRWSSRMLEICGVREEQMPRLFESYASIGTLLPSVAESLGLPADAVVAAGAGDNAGAAIGTGTVGEGKCNISLGTSGTVFISSHTFRPAENNTLHSFCHADGGWHLMGCILSAASCNGWFCDRVLKEGDYNALQREIPDGLLGNNHVYFLPYLMGERCPANDTDASGVFLGLRPSDGRNEMLLAVLEGVCFALRDCVDLARASGISIPCSTVSGGGVRSSLWMRILANVLNMEICIPKTEEGPALGAAILARAADEGTLPKTSTPALREVVSPDARLAALYEERYQFYKKIYPGMKELFHGMKGTEE